LRPPPTATEGALGEALLAVALELIADQPAERLSLRQVAQRVGVSHQAPYVHFGDKRRFLAALAGAGLQRAADAAMAAVAAAEADPLPRLHALVDAYVGFIREQPHVHDLAYGPLVAKADHPRLQAAAIAFWNLTHNTVAACQPEGTSEAEILKRCVATWGTAYGIARLAAMKQFPAAVPAEPDRLLHEAIDTLYHGWQAPAPSTHADGSTEPARSRRSRDLVTSTPTRRNSAQEPRRPHETPPKRSED
jgi:AcrR family transcriptional regulator